jgi:hypothetical protein
MGQDPGPRIVPLFSPLFSTVAAIPLVAAVSSLDSPAAIEPQPVSQHPSKIAAKNSRCDVTADEVWVPTSAAQTV